MDYPRLNEAERATLDWARGNARRSPLTARATESLCRALDEARGALESVTSKCEQYRNCPQLSEAETHAVLEWIEAKARAALAGGRPNG